MPEPRYRRDSRCNIAPECSCIGRRQWQGEQNPGKPRHGRGELEQPFGWRRHVRSRTRYARALSRKWPGHGPTRALSFRTATMRYRKARRSRNSGLAVEILGRQRAGPPQRADAPLWPLCQARPCRSRCHWPIAGVALRATRSGCSGYQIRRGSSRSGSLDRWASSSGTTKSDAREGWTFSINSIGVGRGHS